MNDDGQRGERIAEGFLARHGLRCLARNFRTRRGEIDLICEDGATVVFVEVRWRRAGAPVTALDSIDARKRTRLTLAAQQYLQQQGWTDRRAARFDVVALDGSERVDWVRDAFGT